MREMIVCVAGFFAFAGLGYAADPVKPAPAAPAAERPAEAKEPPAGAPRAQGKPPSDVIFEPPPMPEFMLKKPAKPLTQEEMKRQADEAAEKARRARAAGKADSPAPGGSVSPAADGTASPKM